MNNLITNQSNSGILHVQLNRLDKKNAITDTMYIGLCDALKLAEEKDDICCVVLSGDNECFTAGNDLTSFLSETSNEDLAAIQFIHQLTSFPKPIVAAVSGLAIGIGTTLLLHCDYIVATKSSQFKMPFTQLGVCPEAGSSLLLTEKIGYNRAFELLVLGKSFDAYKAQELGLINEICNQDDLFEIALDVAESIATLPAKAVQASKRLMKSSNADQLNSVIKQELGCFTELLASKETQQIIAQFFSNKK